MSITFERNAYFEKISSYVDEIQTLKHELARKDSQLAKKETQNEILTEQTEQQKDEMINITEKSNSTNLVSLANFARLKEVENELAHTKKENSDLTQKNMVVSADLVKLQSQHDELTKQYIKLKDNLNVEKSEKEYKDWKRPLDEQTDEAPSNILSSTIAVAVNVNIPFNEPTTACRDQRPKLVKRSFKSVQLIYEERKEEENREIERRVRKLYPNNKECTEEKRREIESKIRKLYSNKLHVAPYKPFFSP